MKELANEAGMDVDEALVRLWDAGFLGVTDQTSRISRREMNHARRALRIPTRRELSSISYWRGLFEASGEPIDGVMTRLRISPRFGSGTLPKGAIKKLRAEAGRCGIAPPRDSLPPVVPTTSLAIPEPLEWQVVGHHGVVRLLTESELLHIHQALADDFASTEDPIVPSGVKDANMLASAVFRQQTGLGDEPKYPTAEMVAAALLHGLVHNHPFHNGNKRTALVAMLVLLDENGLTVTCDDEALFRQVLLVAQHRIVDRRLPELADREVLEIAKWLCNNTRRIERRTRPLQWRKLRQILARFGCVTEFTGNGNRINIMRTVERRKFFGLLPKRVVLKTQVWFGGDGRDANRTLIAQIRADLELDEEHGVDSHTFYDEQEVPVGEFILKYQKILRRLARL